MGKKSRLEEIIEEQAGAGVADGGTVGVEDAPWSDPVALKALPTVDAFPLEVLPAALAALAKEVSWAMNVPVDHPAATAVTLASGAIANSCVLAINDTHVKHAALYLAYCNPPGTRKTAPLALLRKPFDRIQAKMLEAFKVEMAAWKRKKEGEGGDRGPKPTARRCIVGDTTTESLILNLADNPRGVVMIRGELSSLMTGMNQYKGGKGHDRQFYLQLWDCETWYSDRKSDQSRDGAPLYVKEPFASIVGTIQPAVLRVLRGEPMRGEAPPDDGFVDRFLICYPDPLPEVGELGRRVDRARLAEWGDAIESLTGLQMVRADGKDGETRLEPSVLRLDQAAWKAWVQFSEEHADEVNDPEFPEHLRGPWSKLRDYCGRFALVLQLLRWAYGDTKVNGAVEEPAMVGAVALVDYFKSHHRRAHACMNSDRRLAAAEKVLGWIRREQPAEFQRWKPYGDLRSKGLFPTPDSLDPALGVLEACNIIRAVEPPARKGPGRKPDTVYLVNPKVLGDRPENPVNPANVRGAPGSDGSHSRDLQDSQDCPQAGGPAPGGGRLPRGKANGKSGDTGEGKGAP